MIDDEMRAHFARLVTLAEAEYAEAEYAEAEYAEAESHAVGHSHTDEWECESCGARMREDDEVCERCYTLVERRSMQRHAALFWFAYRARSLGTVYERANYAGDYAAKVAIEQQIDQLVAEAGEDFALTQKVVSGRNAYRIRHGDQPIYHV